MKNLQLELVSHHLCPYVQRSVITLLEKSIVHKRTYIDLSNKPSWFKEISPTGKVPLLKVNNESILFESAVICEFLDEVTPGTLHPQDPTQKAKHRAWNEFASNTLNDIGRLYNAKSKTLFDEACTALTDRFSRIEPEITGPYFNGEQFSMVDAAYGPVFRYFDVLDTYLPFDIFNNLPKVKAWRSNLASRPSIQQAVAKDYPIQLEDFLLRRDSYLSTVIQEKKPQVVSL